MGDYWDGYPKSAWDRDSKAVVACDGRGNGCVLWTAGPHVRMEVEENGFEQLCDLGLDDAPLGISVWEGRYEYRATTHPDEGCESDPVGKFRRPTDEEWRLIRDDGVCPWDDQEWRR